MEDTLRDLNFYKYNAGGFAGLNPCFNGRYSQSDASQANG